MTATGQQPNLRGITFAKLFPNPAEPFRGAFVADQVAATMTDVDWAVVAPVPLVSERVARFFRKPYVKGDRDFRGIPVFHPRYPVLPRRLLYATVAPLIARTAAPAFERARAHTDAQFVHVHDLYPSGAAARRLCEVHHLPYVVTVHGLDLYSNLANPRWRREIERCAHGARAIICVSRKLAEDTVALLGVDQERVTVIPNTYDTARFHLVERAPRGSGRPLRLLSVGRLSPEKGHELLVRAFAEVLATEPDARLTIIGDGVERSRLTELAVALGIAEKIEFTGVLTGQAVADAMAEADLFVLPSLEEGFGVVLIEAMATGLPVVATRCGGPEGIVEPETGVLVDRDDAGALAEGIRDVISRLDDFDADKIAARTADRYSAHAVGGRLVRLYREVLAGAPISDSLAAEGGSR